MDGSSGDEFVLAPFRYIEQIPGKNFRELFAKAFNAWFEIPADKLTAITEICGLLHNASLLIDDIEDSATLRRGVRAAHIVYGTPLTLNSANYVYFMAFSRILALGNPQGSHIFCEHMMRMHKGQGMEIYFRDFYICPTMEQYHTIAKYKTSGLFSLIVSLCQLFSVEDKRDYTELCDVFGLYFQIRDDFSDLYSPQYHQMKGLASDLTEGKFSYVIANAILKEGPEGYIMKALKRRLHTPEEKLECLAKINETGSYQDTRKTLIDLEIRLRRIIEDLGGNDGLSKIMDALSQVYKSSQCNGKS